MTVDTAADVLNATLAKLEGGAPATARPEGGGGPADTAADPTLAPLTFDGVRWARTPTTNSDDVYGRPRAATPPPVDAGWVAVTPDGACWVVVDALDVDPRTGESDVRCLSCARVTSRDLRPVVEQAWLVDDDLDHISPPDRRAVAEVFAQAAALVAQRMRRRAAAVDEETRWLLAVQERLAAVMHHQGWKR